MKKQIHHIFEKGKDQNTDTPESQEMLALFHSPENEFAIKEKLLDDLSLADSNNTSASPDFKTIFTRVWTRIEQTKSPRKANVRYLSYIGKIAAAVVIGIITGVYAMHITSDSKEPVYYASYSPKGSVSEMILPDGSVIFLNADSRVKYSVEGANGNREVFLEGEAWFDVKKDNTRPFVVHT
ncbi:MAG: FecR family protein, partial [Draconibacterium sp.]